MMDLILIVALVFVLLSAIALFFYGLRFRKGGPERRDYPVFGTLSEEVGRAAEEGTLIHVTLGSGALTGENAVTSIAACEGLTALCNLSAAYDTPPLVTTGDPTLYLLADDWMRRAYARLGNVSRYRSTLVQYLAATPIAYAALAGTYLSARGVGANIMLGAFNQEVSLLMDAALRHGVDSAGGAVSPLALGALYPALPREDLVIGEDLFAAGAEATGEPGFWASVWAANLLRWLVVLGMLGVALFSLLGIGAG
jgi:hypothetical protein